MKDVLDIPREVFVRWMTHDHFHNARTNLSAFREIITDTTFELCFPEASHLPEDESITHRMYFQSKLAEETIVQTADPDVPVLKPQTAEAAIKVTDSIGVAGTVNLILHEHNLDTVYQAPRHVKRTNVMDESDKSAWAMVVLQLTAMESIPGLDKNDREYLRKVLGLNSKKL